MTHLFKIKTVIGLIIIMSLAINLAAQEGYQASTHKGFGIRISGLGDIWKGDIISDKSSFGGGLDITATFGIVEKFGIFAGFQNVFPSKLDPSEVGFLVYTDNIKHQNFTGGLMVHLGSPSSKLRYTVLAGLMYAQSTVETLQAQHDILVDIKLKGLGLHSGIGLDYFVSPFLSTSLYAHFNTGKYKSSEYVGITYTESIKWSRPQFALGINYHFAGR